jgi:HPt (histidine-containing phosphotransfer) domain-containing protein
LEKSKRKPESGDVVTASASEAETSQLNKLPLSGQGSVSIDSVLDQSALDNLLKLIGGDLELLAELIDIFLRSGPNLLENLEQSISKDDAAGLRMAAHSLKANAADFGATILANLCQELEELGKAGQLDGAADYTNQIQAEYVRVQVALENLREYHRA